MEQTYDEFIQNILDERGRFNCGDAYCERHHIKPRCIDGDNSTENLIDLYAHEHFIAHKLLAQENPDNKSLVYAWTCMAFTRRDYQQRYELTPEEYKEAKIARSIVMSGENNPNYGKPAWNKGKHLSEECKLKLSEANKGKTLSEETRKKISEKIYGTTKSEETRKKMSESTKNSWTDDRRNKHSGKNNPMFSNTHTEEICKKQSERMKERWQNEEYRELMSGENHPFFGCGEKHPMFGKHHSDETRKKISKSHQGIFSGGKNPRAKQVIRLCDGKIYDCGKYAAEENKISYGVFQRKCVKHDEFMYYNEWLTQQND